MQAAIQELLAKRQTLIAERDRILEQYHKEICEIESALELIYGKKVWQIETTPKYDDENPNYIKGSYEKL